MALADIPSTSTDDLPVIKESVRKGFVETQSKVNKWISDFKKRIDGDEDEDEPTTVRPMGGTASRVSQQQQQHQQPHQQRTSTDAPRRSSERDRYDPDPRALGDDFTTLELRDDEGMRLAPRANKVTIEV